MTTAKAMFLPARGDDEGSPPLPGPAWQASVVGLHGAFAVITGLAAATALSGSRDVGDELSRAWALAALGVLAVAYALAGAPAIAREAPVRAVVYLSTLVAVLGVLGVCDPDALFLLFLAYPQVWFLVEHPRPGTVWTVLLATSSSIGLFVHLAGTNGSSRDGSGMVVGLLFSLLLGTWTSRVLKQSRERAALIAAVERTREDLAEAHHWQGVMAERERLAREVHDTLAQGYTSIVVLAETAQTELLRSPERARERLALIEDVARDNLRETRAIVAAFAPSELDGSTLVEALRRLTERFERETEVRIILDLSDVDLAAPLRREQEVVLLRASQEALSNARRHARASEVTLRLRCDGVRTSVVVEDDGDGFDTDHAVGSGLTGLRHRLEQAGGVLEVSSAPGKGTTVAARLGAAPAAGR